jgi:vacuolar-type H+-ATPase subunit H
MGFAFEDGTGLPVIDASGSTNGWQPAPTPPPPPPIGLDPSPGSVSEAEIGDIMLKVQRFADETAEEAQRQARAVIADAQVEAASIVSRARREAEEVVAAAIPQISSEAVASLCSAIEGFAETNRVLVEELAQLRDALTGSYSDTPLSTHSHLSAVPPTAS